MARLQDKVAFVTGAASGIGAASALRFAQEGASIVGFDLKEAFDGDWAEAAKTAPGHLFTTGDVRDPGALEAAVAAATDGSWASPTELPGQRLAVDERC